MTETFKAIYRDGVFRPLEPLSGIPEDQPVDLTLNVANVPHSLKECFGILSDADAAEMTAIVDAEFEKVDPDEWK